MKTSSTSEWIAFGPFVVFPKLRSLKCDGKQINIGDVSLDLLIALIENPGEIYSKQELAERVWNREWVEDANLRMAVASLRKLLGRTTDGGEFIVNTVGRGYSFSALVPLERWPRPAASAKFAGPIAGDQAGRLPPLIRPVIGREKEIKQLIALMGRYRLVTITGTGGIGKTTVAIATASRFAEIDEGVHFVDFAPIVDSALVPVRVATSLGLHATDGDPLTYILRQLSRKRRLLVLDNCEHVADVAAELAERILREIPRVKIIATSREALRIEDESILRLSGLEVPDDGTEISAAAALKFPAVQLFVERTKALVPDFSLTDDIAPAATEICRRLDGMALAIQLAASRVAALGVRGVAARLDDRFSLLTSGMRTALPRHRTLEAVFNWSFELLNPAERSVFQRLSAFRGAFTLDAAKQIAGWSVITPQEAEAVVADLVDKSLVVFTGEGASPSYRMLETVRAFAEVRLQSAGEENEVGKRHAERVIAQSRNFHSPASNGDGSSAGSAARSVLDDLRSALQWAFDTQNCELAFDLVSAAIPLFTHLGLSFELKIWVDRSLQIETEPRTRLVLLNGLANSFHMAEGNSTREIELWNEAFLLAQQLGDITSALQALRGLIGTTFVMGAYRRALQYAHQFSDFAATHDRTIEVLIGQSLAGNCLHTLGERDEAERLLRDMLARYPSGSRATEIQLYLLDPCMVSRIHLALIEWAKGDQEAASATMALAVADAGDHVPSLFTVLAWCACVIVINREDWITAERYIHELIQHARHHPLWRSWADALHAIYDIRVNRSEVALARLNDTMAAPNGPLHPSHHPWYRIQRIRALMQFGRSTNARPLLELYIATAREREEFWFLPEMLWQKGILERDSDPTQADASFSQALDLARRNNWQAFEAHVTTCYAEFRPKPQPDRPRSNRSKAR